MGDWVLEGGDLRDNAVLLTSIILCVFSDARAPDDRDLPTSADDRRGWWGDQVDVRAEDGETELGSLLWLYERSAITDETLKGIKDTVYDSLQTLEDQGAIASRAVEVEADRGSGHVYIEINVYSRDGQKRYSQRFSRLWGQVSGL
ncbi:phage GP46 family protein [Sulfitobacter sp. 1A15106]|uniref:phage GP46 family protein n=1 Tax=Sulfitobacter sp. 1A15106 TaxID=3368590 RepID=UPI003744C7F4